MKIPDATSNLPDIATQLIFQRKEKCEQCLVMSGQLNNASSSGGVCPLVSVWKILGGYGGGGASCGPGGGGGAGYHGVVHFSSFEKEW